MSTAADRRAALAEKRSGSIAINSMYQAQFPNAAPVTPEGRRALMSENWSGSEVQNDKYNTQFPNATPVGGGGGGQVGSGIGAETTPVANEATQEQPLGPNEKDLVPDGGLPPSKLDAMGSGGKLESLEKAQKHAENGSTPTDGAIGDNAIDEDIAATNLAEQKKRLNDALTANGAPPEKTINDMIDEEIAKLKKQEASHEITQEVHTRLRDRWKNLRNIIPREDMGMVLMDFGFRAMIAGETMGDMAALGAAGQGALAGVAQRKEQDYQRDIDQRKAAGETVRANIATQTAVDAEGKRLPDTYDTTAGKFTINENGDLEAMVDPDSGERLMPSASDKRSVKSWEVEEWKSRFPGMTDQDVWLATASGLTPQMAYDRASSKFDQWYNSANTTKRSTLRIAGKDVRKDQLTDKQIEAWKLERVRGYGYSEGALPKAGGGGEGGALNNGDSGGRISSKRRYIEAGNDPADWDAYNITMDEIEGYDGS